jgi:hypothetical protein
MMRRNRSGPECLPPLKTLLACLLGEVWTTPHVQEPHISPDGGFLARHAGHVSFD